MKPVFRFILFPTADERYALTYLGIVLMSFTAAEFVRLGRVSMADPQRRPKPLHAPWLLPGALFSAD